MEKKLTAHKNEGSNSNHSINSKWNDILKCCLFSITSGVILSACFPGMGDTGGLVFLWAIPLFYILFTLKPEKLGRKGLLLGYLCGLSFWLLNLKWLLRMAELPHVPTSGALLSWLILPAYLSCYFAIFGYVLAKWGNPWRPAKEKTYSNRIDAKIAKKLKQETPGKIAQSFKESMHCLKFALMHASLWSLLEWLRSTLLTGFSWNGLGVAFYDIPVLAQTAELVGVVGLSFFPMFFGSVLFQLITRMIKEASSGLLKPHWDMGIAGLIIAGMFGFGVIRLYDITNAPSKDVNVLLVQQNISLAEKHNDQMHVGSMMNYAVYTEEGLEKVDLMNAKKFKEAQENGTLENFKEEKVDFVIWPESTLLNGIQYIEEEKSYFLTEVENRALLETFEVGAPKIISGCNEYHFPDYDAPLTKSYNSIAVIAPQNGAAVIDTVYQKNHLVMFGEYIPYRDTFPFLEKLVGGGGSNSLGPNFNSGGSTEPLKVDHQGDELQLIGSVCFEDTVGRLTRNSIRSADQMIINVTNDGWFGESESPKQHFTNALFRSIELRRPMVRSTNTGISCVINAKGSILNENGSKNAILDDNDSSFIAGTLYANVRILTDGPLTLYALAGDWFILLCAVIFCITFVSVLHKRVA